MTTLPGGLVPILILPPNLLGRTFSNRSGERGECYQNWRRPNHRPLGSVC
jgi:hypothetical protein